MRVFFFEKQMEKAPFVCAFQKYIVSLRRFFLNLYIAVQIALPISKSIANRLLILQARAGVPLMELDENTPEDVRVLHDALELLAHTHSPVINVDNCGTAMRFLTAYCALSDHPALLTGCARMQQRPIGQLVDALRILGANIEYMGQVGYPPLRILPQRKDACAAQSVAINQPQSTQFISALLLMGVEIETDSRYPYIEMTKQCIKRFSSLPSQSSTLTERDWSSAAFWYEWVALHGGELLLQGLTEQSLQGDRVVANLFEPLGVSTTFTPDGTLISRTRASIIPHITDSHAPSRVGRDGEELTIDFSACPDLYPAIAITCEQLGISLHATGTDSLRIKESDRLQAIAEHRTYGDHRIAMALLAADLPCDNTDCIKKSYPSFLTQLNLLKTQSTPILAGGDTGVPGRSTPITPIIPRRGVNDEGKGKKHALHRLICQAHTDYVWLMDDDILPAPALRREDYGIVLPRLYADLQEAIDLFILPLRMQPMTDHTPNLLERLQMAEYAAIQALTLLSAKHGHPVLCSSANLIVRRYQWLNAYPDLHPELASGDDMFLLESFKRRQLHIAASEDEDLTAIVRPVRTWRAFVRQRMRWAGKAPAYQDRDIRLCGAIVLIANILQIFCPLILLIKFPIEYALIRYREPKISVGIAFLLELIYPFYLLFSLLGGIFHTLKHPQTTF